MRPLVLVVLSLTLSPAAAAASAHHRVGHSGGVPAVGSGSTTCAPGLARRDPPCVPPGRARRG